MPSISDTVLIKGEPIISNFLTFYPITMEHYELWQRNKGVLTIRMATLPALYAVKPYIAALYAHDIDSKRESDATGTPYTSWTEPLAVIMNLAMRLPLTYKPFVFAHAPDKDNELTSVVMRNGETQVTLPPHKFREIRELLAAQNGEELPDEAENPELLKAQNDIAGSNAPNLKYDYKALVASVAHQSGIRDRDVLEWTIREFNERRAAIDRDKRHTICGFAEGNGAKWKAGNPAPSWCYEKEQALAGGFTTESEMLSKLGKVGSVR